MLTSGHSDDVSSIHKRWSFTRLMPSTFSQSYAGSLACGAVIILAFHLYHLQSDATTITIHLSLAIGALAALHFVDYLALRGTPVNRVSKVAHVSLFANMLWALTLLLGIAADLILAKNISSLGLNYAVAGMLLAAGLRVGIFTSVFGSRLLRSILVSFIQPVVFFIALVPVSAYGALEASYGGLAFGAVLFLLGVVWTIVADRSGRPDIHSTFGLLQAFLAASTENRVDKIEGFTEARAQDKEIQTRVIKFLPAGNASGHGSAAIVLPDLHPGPFGTVGGSDLPYVLYQAFSRSALVMHSVSDHSLNIPSKRELDKYVSSLSGLNVVRRGDTCSDPVQVKVGRATTTGIALGDTALVMLSLAPVGMEDVAKETREELESYGAGLGFDSVLVIDCHNAMGKHLTEVDQIDLVQSAKQCLESLRNGPQKKFSVGFATLEDDDASLRGASELGRAGIAVLVIRIEKRQYAIGWADSNNMHNRLREAILSRLRSGVSMLEVCTSDTHSTSGKKNKEGYFALGTLTSHETIASAFAEISRKAADRATENSSFELASAHSRIRVMGEKQFEEYSSALDRSMNVTKYFVVVTAATYVAMLAFA